ncbi:MAG: type II secretion system F family protein, partial [Planctomycetaceae bacterium]
MPEFAYTARAANGRDVAGLISAETKRDVLAMLTERALFPMKVEPAGGPKRVWKLQRPIKAEILAATLTQLSDLLENGVPLMRSLEVLSEQATHPRLQEVL